MSHSHTHAPGEQHSHSHSHGPPQQQQPQQMQVPPVDPVMQAVIEQDFQPVDLTLGKAPENDMCALCEKHQLEKCDECGVDFLALNRLARLLANNPTLRCPPPANVISQNLSKAITNTKEEGNAFFKMGQHDKAIARYNMAANLAVQRPPWESNGIMREELSTVISNRSAAYFEAGDFISALTDAETVITLRRNWSKGHFRKAKAMLALQRLEEAQEAVRLGLQFEPQNAELNTFLGDIEKVANSLEKVKTEVRALGHAAAETKALAAESSVVTAS